jgi:hypothetical protein
MGLGTSPTFRPFLLAFCSASPGCRVGHSFKFKVKGLETKGTFFIKKTATEGMHALQEQSRLRASKNIDTEFLSWFLPLRPKSGKGVKVV